MLIRPMDTFYVRIHVVLTSSDIRLCSFSLHFERREPNFDRNVPSTFRRVGGWGRGLRGLGRIEGQMLVLRIYSNFRRNVHFHVSIKIKQFAPRHFQL